MCLIAFAWGANERFPFVIAANRDEFLHRPTAPLALWQSPGGADVLAGRDLQAGGIWMGFSPNGRFAMLTNVRDPKARPPDNAISRGGLALAWLESRLPVQAWSRSLEPQRYPGFNLIAGDWKAKQCHYLTNQAHLHDNLKPFEQIAGIEYARSATELIAHELPWGAVYGLSNAALDTPWPKTQRVKNALLASLACEDAEQLKQQNLDTLKERFKPSDHDLPNTGVSAALERALSSPFVAHPEAAPSYGTRTSLVAVFQAGLGMRITEITHAQAASVETATQAQLGWL